MNKRSFLIIGYAMAVFLFGVYLADLITDGTDFKEAAPAFQESVLPATTAQRPSKYFIPLGSTEMKSMGVWADTGAQVYIDPADYPGATLTWEAAFKIPTGNGQVCARLFDLNRSWPVGGSEICASGSTFTHVSSGQLTFWDANHLYRVELKTSMEYEAVMTGARMKVIY